MIPKSELTKLTKKIRSKIKNIPSNSKEDRARKGVYADCLLMIKEILDKHV